MMATHSNPGPSGFSRWSRCPGSVRMEANLPRTSSEYAARGTMCHEIAELCLRTGRDTFSLIGDEFEADGYRFTFEEADSAITQAYIDNVREVVNGQ